MFFDMPHPEQVEPMTIQAMKAAGIDPAVIYAYEKTGRLVTEDNQHPLSEADLDEWQAAIEEYDMKHRKRKKPPQHPIGQLSRWRSKGLGMVGLRAMGSIVERLHRRCC